MPIVSISIPDETLSDIDRATKQSEHPGRSAFIREAMQHYLDDLAGEQDISGEIDAIVIISHDHDEASFSALRHQHQGLVRAHLHQDANHRCHEILLMHGQASKLRALLTDARQRTFHARWYPLR